MATKNIKVGLQLGVLGASQLKSAFGQTRREVESLKTSTDKLARANRAASDASISFATKGRLALARLRGGYEGVTKSLGGLRMAAMAAAAVPVALGVNKALNLQDLSVDLAMTAGLDRDAEKAIAGLIQNASRSGNQTHTETGAAAKLLVDGGVRDLQSLGEYLPILTQSATAARASIQTLSNMALASKDNMGMAAGEFRDSLNMMFYAAGKGKMGVEAMASAIPQLSLRMQELSPEINLSAQDMMADFVAGLQVARLGANSDAEAARNLDAFMYRIFSPETGKRFESAGIHLENSIKNLTGEGLTPFEAMLETLTNYVGRQGEGALDALNAAVFEEDAAKRDAAFSALDARYALGNLFVDEGVKNFTIAAMKNRQMLRELKTGISQAAGQDLITVDFIRRMGSAKEQMKGLGNALADVGITLSGPIVDGLLSVGLALLPMLQGAAAWVQQNPELVKGIVTVGGAVLGLRLAIAGVGLAFKAGAWVVGGFTGTLTKLWTALGWVWRAFKWLTPVGRIISLIVAGGALIVKYWEPIVGFFKGIGEGVTNVFTGMWARITEAFDGGIAGVGKLLLDWSPLGLFYKAFAGVLNWFGIEIPQSLSEAGTKAIGAFASSVSDWSPLALFRQGMEDVKQWFSGELPDTFSGFGGMLVDGLTGGVTKALTRARDTIVNFGSNIKGWFSSVLDIRSPSRVFVELGGFVSEGAALGIRQGIPQASRAVGELAGMVADAGNRVPASVALRAPAFGGLPAAQQMHIEFSPTIHITAAAGSDIEAQAGQAMSAMKRQFERWMREREHQQQRTAFAGAY